MTVSIDVRNVVFKYPSGDVVVRVENLQVEKGSIVSILGPSGCGKTTFLLILGGLIQPNHKADISICGLPVNEAIRNGLVSISFQTPVLMPWRTAIGNVSLPLELKAQPIQVKELEGALDRVRLHGAVQKLFPLELSSGMRSRVAVAQAMVSGAAVLLMDEVFGTLDEATRVQMNLMLREINSTEMNSTILFVTHSIGEALLLGDRVVVFRKPHSEGVSSIVADLQVKLPKRSSKVRYTPEFLDLKKHLELIFF